MKTTLELEDDLMRAVKIRAAQTDRKLKDVVAELIQLGLAAVSDEAGRSPSPQPRKQDDALDDLIRAGEDLARNGVDFTQWAASSREVWRTP